MARKPRIHFPGAIYLVTVRGNNMEEIFYDDIDKKKYLNLMEHYKARFDFLLYSFVLMNNHLHFITEVKEIPLSKIMQGIQLSFTQYFNKKYTRVGHVFQQRYESILCSKDEHLLNLIKYLHENPVRSELTKSCDYAWSSHFYYLREDSAPVDSSFPLSLLDKNRKKAKKKYLQLMYHTPLAVLPEIKVFPIAGGRPARSQQENPSGKPDLKDILALVTRTTNITKEQLLKKTKKPEISRARKLFLYLVICNEILSRTDTAKFLGLSPSAITKAFNEADEDKQFQALLKKIHDHDNGKRFSQGKA